MPMGNTMHIFTIHCVTKNIYVFYGSQNQNAANNVFSKSGAHLKAYLTVLSNK